MRVVAGVSVMDRASSSPSLVSREEEGATFERKGVHPGYLTVAVQKEVARVNGYAA
jgi:hypothetical protein